MTVSGPTLWLSFSSKSEGVSLKVMVKYIHLENEVDENMLVWRRLNVITECTVIEYRKKLFEN